MNVLWIVSWYPNKYAPLSGDFIQRMATSVSPFCNLAVLYIAESDNKSVSYSVSTNTFTEIIIYAPKFNSKIRFVNECFRFYMYLKCFNIGLKNLTKHFEKPDIMHLHVMYPAGILVLYYNIFRNIPLFITEHWMGYLKEKWNELSWFQIFLSRYLVKKAVKVFPVSDILYKEMQQLGLKGDYEVIPNVVDTELFNVKPVKSAVSSNFTFLHISNLIDPIKNVSGIIKAFAKVYRNNRQCRLRIVGEGPDQDRFQKLVNSLSLIDCVTFTGYITYAEVKDEMHAADAFILFSNYETFSCVTAEAMAVGLPIIISESIGISDWVTSECGIVVNSGNEEQLVKAMEAIIAQHRSFDPLKIRRVIVYKCSYSLIGKRIYDNYCNILG